MHCAPTPYYNQDTGTWQGAREIIDDTVTATKIRVKAFYAKEACLQETYGSLPDDSSWIEVSGHM